MEPLNEPMPNLPLLRKVLDHIDAHPEEWDQRWWENVHSTNSRAMFRLPATCGTTRCIAGLVEFWGTGKVHMPHTYAMKALGLTAEEAWDLFRKTASIYDRDEQRAAVQKIAERIAERAGERL